MEKEKKKSLKSLLLGLAALVCLIGTVVLYFALDNQELEYEVVRVRVVDENEYTTTIRAGTTRSTIEHYEVTVSYDGKEYDLENVHNEPWKYDRGKTIDAYLSNGHIYANVEGVRTSTPVGYAYFTFLIGTFVMGFLWILSLVKGY